MIIIDMFSSEFTLFLERYLVIPLVGAAIAHGFVAQGDSTFWVTILDQVFGGLFILIAYVATHKKIAQTTTTTQTSLWNKLKTWIFSSTTTTTTASTPPVAPSTEVAQV